MKKLILLLICCLLSGCSSVGQWMVRDFDKYGKNTKDIPFNSVKIGDTKEQVTNAMGKPVNIVASEQTQSGTLEVWEYEKWSLAVGIDHLEAKYYVYFLDGRLQKWALVDRAQPVVGAPGTVNIGQGYPLTQTPLPNNSQSDLEKQKAFNQMNNPGATIYYPDGTVQKPKVIRNMSGQKVGTVE